MFEIHHTSAPSSAIAIGASESPPATAYGLHSPPAHCPPRQSWPHRPQFFASFVGGCASSQAAGAGGVAAGGVAGGGAGGAVTCGGSCGGSVVSPPLLFAHAKARKVIAEASRHRRTGMSAARTIPLYEGVASEPTRVRLRRRAADRPHRRLSFETLARRAVRAMFNARRERRRDRRLIFGTLERSRVLAIVVMLGASFETILYSTTSVASWNVVGAISAP
jgi:hypothetical protein